jgi:hypothetical protein
VFGWRSASSAAIRHLPGPRGFSPSVGENLGFVSGHDFSRAVNCENVFGFSRWGQNFCPTFLFFRSVLDEPYSRN